MKNRVITAIIGIPVVFLLIYLSNIPLKVFLIITSLTALKELFKLFFPEKGLLSFEFIVATLGIILLFINYKIEIYLLLFIIYAVYYVLINNKLLFLKNISLLLFSIIYSSAGFLYLFLIRNNFGFTAIIFILTTTWICDTGAYFIGINFGNTKLAPEISPNKSIEGAIGGIISSIIYSIIFYSIFKSYFSISIYKYILSGIIIGSIGQFGDLFESLIKRKFEVKDSGSLLPGHGGILDRCDSLIFNSIVIYQILII